MGFDTYSRRTTRSSKLHTNEHRISKILHENGYTRRGLVRVLGTSPARLRVLLTFPQLMTVQQVIVISGLIGEKVSKVLGLICGNDSSTNLTSWANEFEELKKQARG